MNHLQAAALAFHDHGYCVVPTRPDGTKAPAGAWKQHQTSRPTRQQITAWFTGDRFHGFGLICGAVSGGLEMLEFEGRAVKEGIHTKAADLARNTGLADLWDKVTAGYTEHTPSGGIHLLYRVDGTPAPNTKLARRPATPTELEANPKDKVKVLAETRGEGGYVVVAPSGGPTHPTGASWTLEQGGTATIATISEEERDALHNLLRAFDQTPEPAPASAPKPTKPRDRDSNELTPGDDYNARATWDQILTPRGWTRLHQQGTTVYWCRPGKDRGISATTGRNDSDNLYVFSTSTDFEDQTPYTKFGAIAHLDHAGDFSAAARELAADGYGTQRPARTWAEGVPLPPEPPEDYDWAPPEDWTTPQPHATPERATQPARKATARPWAEPTALSHTAPPALPIDACGPIIGPLAEDISHALQAPADIAINFALSVITTAAQGRWKIRVNRDWTEVLSVSTTSVANSGERKSPILSILTKPLTDVEKDLRKDGDDDRAWRDEEISLAEARITQLRKQAIKSRDAELELRAALDHKNNHLKPIHLPRLTADDATPEALINLLSQQDGTIGVLSAEPGFFATLAGRYSNGVANLDGALKATSGERIQVDRVGRDAVVIDDPCLTVAVCVQPGLLEQIGKKPELRYAGFLARFMYVQPEPMVGRRAIMTTNSVDSVDRSGTYTSAESSVEIPIDQQPFSNIITLCNYDQGVRTRWATALRTLTRYAYTLKTSTQSTELTLDAEAEKTFTHFRAQLEPRLHPQTGDLASINDWGAKLPGNTTRIAAALTLLADPNAKVIKPDTMADAIRLAKAYIPHAQAVLDGIRGHSDGLGPARDVLDAIKRAGEHTFTQRDIHRALEKTAWVKDGGGADAIADALNTLADHNHIRPVDVDRPGPGRKPSPTYEVNPVHLAGRNHLRSAS